MKKVADIELPDGKLIELFRKDKREGFRLTYGKYAGRLFSVCRRYATDDQEARDYLHEAMLKVFDKIPAFKYDGEGSLYRWITRLTVNMIMDKRKWKRRHREVKIDDIGFEIQESESVDAMNIPAEEMRGMLAALSPVKRGGVQSFLHRGIFPQGNRPKAGYFGERVILDFVEGQERT